MGDDWHNRTRNVFLHTYINRIKWEQRPINCVERTYLECREQTTWHVEFESVEAEARGQVAKVEEESDEDDRDVDEDYEGNEYGMGEEALSDGEEMDTEYM
jgi:hypothetical protein